MKLRPPVLREQMQVHGRTWTSAGAACGLCFGLVPPLIGSFLTVIAWFTGPSWHGLFIQRYGTVLLFLTIPFLLFGGHCLDLSDKQREEARKRRSN